MSQKEDILYVLDEAEVPLKTQEVADRLGKTYSGVWDNLTNVLPQEGKVEQAEENPAKWKIADDTAILTTEDSIHADNKTYNNLEEDIQTDLFKNIEQLTEGLTTESDRTDTEYSVESGFIDILAEDSEGNPVVIEIKTGKARNGVLAQIKAYMSNVTQEFSCDLEDVTGLIVAEDFSEKLTEAITIESNITLYAYEREFEYNSY